MGGISESTGKLVNILIRKCDVDKSKRIYVSKIVMVVGK